MATHEQIAARLKKRIKSEADLRTFFVDWGGEISTNKAWTTEELIQRNIKRVLANTTNANQRDALGMRLGFPSDQHAAFTRDVWTDRRSWTALIVALMALVASIFALLRD